MPDPLLNILLIFLVLAVIWFILKAILKFTFKVFGCGLFLLLVIGLLAYWLTNFKGF